MARSTKKSVELRIRVSFNGMEAGDVCTVDLSPRVQGWINAGVAEVVDSGTDQTGPSSALPDDDERVTGGAEGGVPSGGEPGEGAGAGTDGTSA